MGLTVRLDDPPTEPLKPLDDYTQKVLRMRRRGMAYPYEIVRFLTAGGMFAEYDLVADELVPVDRPFGRNTAGVVVGLVTRRRPSTPRA